MCRMNDTVKNGIGYCRVPHHVIPVGCRVLRSYDNGFPFMPVFDNFEQYRTFLGVKRYKEQVIENKQLAPFNLLEFCFKRTLDFGNFQCAKEFWSIGIESTESPFARLMAEGTGQIAFSRTGRSGDEKILPPYAQSQGWPDVPSGNAPILCLWHSQSVQGRPCSEMPHSW